MSQGDYIRTIIKQQIEHIMEKLNDQPKISLDFLITNEVFYEHKRLA